MPYRKTPSRLHHAEAVRSSLVRAGTALLREGGIAAVTVRSVVARAESSVGNYYHHFANKDELLLAMAQSVMEEHAATVDAISSAVAPGSTRPNALARVATMVAVGIQLALEEPALGPLTTATGLGERVRAMILDHFLERTCRQFSRPEFASLIANPPVTATLWQGAILMLIERATSGKLAVDRTPADVALECAAWNLRALGVSRREQQEALARAERALAS